MVQISVHLDVLTVTGNVSGTISILAAEPERYKATHEKHALRRVVLARDASGCTHVGAIFFGGGGKDNKDT